MFQLKWVFPKFEFLNLLWFLTTATSVLKKILYVYWCTNKLRQKSLFVLNVHKIDEDCRNSATSRINNRDIWLFLKRPISAKEEEILQPLTLISNGNRTEWSPIRSVIIRVITKSLFITSVITDWIGRHEVLSSINHKNYNFREKEKYPSYEK